MQIVYHIGANCTDDDRLIRSLMKNADSLAAQGILVPQPGRYRKLIRETIQNLRGQTPPPGTREQILRAVLDGAEANRLVMSNSAFICVPPRVFEGGTFYRMVEVKVASLVRLFPQDEIELHLALRNPATFIPAVLAELPNVSYEAFMNGLSPLDVRWPDVVARIRKAAPAAGLTVWSNEDTPLIWPQLIRELSGLDPLTRIVGGFDLLNAIMAPEGMNRLLSYLKTHPPQTEIQKRRIVAAFLDKFALEDQIEEEVDLPGWTDTLVQQMSDQYEEDIFAIEKMPGVHFIAP